MKKICVLLTSSIHKDFRVIKTIQVLSSYCKVDLYYLRPNDGDIDIFNQNTRLFPLKQRLGLREKLLRHSFFFDEFNYFYHDICKHEVQYDYIWANDLTALKPAFFLKKKYNAKLVYDSHEIYIETLSQFFPENATGIKKLVFNSLLKLMRFLGDRAERAMVANTDIFITVSESVKEYFQKRFQRNDISVVLNCPSLQQESYEAVDLKKALGFDHNVFLLLYQGVMSYGRGLPLMIEAQKYTSSNIKFVLMGDGMLKESLIALTVKLGLQDKIKFIDRVPTNKLLTYTRAADGGIILQETDKNLSKKLGIANKLFEYMHAGIPFVATNAPENNAVASRYNICIIVENNIQTIAEGINKLQHLDKMLIKEEALKASSFYNWEKQAEIIRNLIV